MREEGAQSFGGRASFPAWCAWSEVAQSPLPPLHRWGNRGQKWLGSGAHGELVAVQGLSPDLLWSLWGLEPQHPGSWGRGYQTATHHPEPGSSGVKWKLTISLKFTDERRRLRGLGDWGGGGAVRVQWDRASLGRWRISGNGKW